MIEDRSSASDAVAIAATKYVTDRDRLRKLALDKGNLRSALRAAAMRALADQATSLEILERGDTDEDVINAALGAVTDREALSALARTHPLPIARLRAAAASGDRANFRAIALEDTFARNRLSAMVKLSDPAITADRAWNDPSMAVREEAVSRLNDEELLVLVASSDPSPRIREMARSRCPADRARILAAQQADMKRYFTNCARHDPEEDPHWRESVLGQHALAIYVLMRPRLVIGESQKDLPMWRAQSTACLRDIEVLLTIGLIHWQQAGDAADVPVRKAALATVARLLGIPALTDLRPLECFVAAAQHAPEVVRGVACRPRATRRRPAMNAHESADDVCARITREYRAFLNADSSFDEPARIAALADLNEDPFLDTIAQTGHGPKVREAALSRLRDWSLAADIAWASRYDGVRETALRFVYG
jgi:hypothetical protein